MRPQGNGIVVLHDEKQKERGYHCMKLIQFLTEDGVKDWDEWHDVHLRAAEGQCPYTGRCPIHARSVEKALNNPRKPLQLTLF